ncbi:MAG: nucleoid occlusion factor SlmA [Gammaproteobacteria bacterium]
MARHKTNRRQHILETLARELESHPGSRITTAELAAAVGVSEAALYRHFASKAKMFEALIDFAEESVFGIINTILAQDKTAVGRCEKILRLLLGFAERNPGITRVLLGDALVGEHERLRARVNQFFERIETQFRQILREANLANDVRTVAPIDATANHMAALAEGMMSRYARSEFTRRPTAHWEEQWPVLRDALFRQ